MDEKKEQMVQHFLKSMTELYENIRSWLDIASLQTSPLEEIELREEAYGAYKAQKMTIQDADGITIADIMPVGAGVIGASGRVDLVGKYDRVIIVLLEKGGPIITTMDSGGKPSVTRFYKDIKEAGWYWIEDRRRGKAHKIDKEIFYELLTEVSDYEFSQSP